MEPVFHRSRWGFFGSSGAIRDRQCSEEVRLSLSARLTTPRKGMGALHCADRREPGDEGVTRRWLGAVVLVLVAAACNGDDDDAVETSVPETTAVTTEPPATTEAPPETTESTTSTTAEATTTTVDVEALKAQIAADYLRSQQALEDLSRESRRSTDLEAAVSCRSPSPGLRALSDHRRVHSRPTCDRRADRRRVTPTTPTSSSSRSRSTVGPTRPTCHGLLRRRTQSRIDAGRSADRRGDVLAARVRQTMAATSAGWLLASELETGVDIERGVTSCPA